MPRQFRDEPGWLRGQSGRSRSPLGESVGVGAALRLKEILRRGAGPDRPPPAPLPPPPPPPSEDSPGRGKLRPRRAEVIEDDDEG